MFAAFRDFVLGRTVLDIYVDGKGVVNDVTRCPVALAIQKYVNVPVEVCHTHCYIGQHRYEFSDFVSQRIRLFDHFGTMAPFRFFLKVRSKYVRPSSYDSGIKNQATLSGAFLTPIGIEKSPVQESTGAGSVQAVTQGPAPETPYVAAVPKDPVQAC